ncbi:putative transcription factor C2H2 family [Helianthus annuus]|nr:putative transcription factor C2H2 family [Helianthus annuus]KAJ0625632.1 putative transcription factor C2H2 family [Helianthus annuus]KAJ0782003.1 putative transcription factor C2H2 family [Helianthus annuus]
MSNQVVEVRRDELAACMTCPICNKLFRDATTIPECLHTFCRRCIRKKLTDEELECCPICKIDLGCVPLEKLRADHNLQDVRAKIFPYKRRRVKAPEAAASVTLPLRRKERSLSSLVVSTPRVSTQTTLTGKRSKVTSRKKSRGSSFSVEKRPKKEDDSMEDCQESSSSPETSNRVKHNSKQNSSTDEEKENGKPWEEKVDWKPLNDLVEAANRSKSSKHTAQGSVVKSEPSYTVKVDKNVPKFKGKDPLQRSKVQDDSHEVDDAAESVKPKKLRRKRKKKDGGLGDSGVGTAQSMVVAGGSNGGREKRSYPIWFQLVPFEEQEGEPLRQIEGRYVKLNDGNVPISIIQKLVMNKLQLPSEHEVELRCMGQPVGPTLQLRNLMEQWLQAHPDTITANVGSSAHEFVMEISYAKKAPPPVVPAPQTP